MGAAGILGRAGQALQGERDRPLVTDLQRGFVALLVEGLCLCEVAALFGDEAELGQDRMRCPECRRPG